MPNMPSQSQVRRVWNKLRNPRPRISRENTHGHDNREKTGLRHNNVESGTEDKDTNSQQQRRFKNDGCQNYRQRHKSEPFAQQIRPTPERAVTFSAEQGENKAQPSGPCSDTTWPGTRKTPTFRSTLSSSGKSIRSGLKKLNCLPPIFAAYQGSRHSERDYHGPTRARTVPIRSKGSHGSSNGVVLSIKNPDDENRPKLVQTASTFPRANMSSFPRDLQDSRTRLRARAETSKVFNKIWEEKALPRLQETMEDKYKGDYSVTVQFDYVHSQRIIEVMTEIELRDDISEKVETEVLHIFRVEPMVSLSVGFQFVEGTVEPSADTSSSAPAMREEGWDGPINTKARNQLMLGDSIGCDGIEGAATLGPMISFNGNLGYIVSRHLFDTLSPIGTQNLPGLHLVHPAGIDCQADRQPQVIAELRADSGPAYMTYRASRTLRAFTTSTSQDPPHVITDWAVFLALDTDLKMRNCLRYVPQEREVETNSDDLRGLFLENPQLQTIQCSGRSSGVRYGVVCETPAAVKHSSTGTRTREWFVENEEGYPGMISQGQWNTGGIGMPGDSGAAIIEVDGQRLVGQIWGRNVYGGDTRIKRIAYFTHFVDVFDDIHEKSPGMSYPTIFDPTGNQSREPPILLAMDDRSGSSAMQSLPRHSYDSSPRRSRAHSTDERTIATTVSERSLSNLDWSLKAGIIVSK